MRHLVLRFRAGDAARGDPIARKPQATMMMPTITARRVFVIYSIEKIRLGDVSFGHVLCSWQIDFLSFHSRIDRV